MTVLRRAALAAALATAIAPATALGHHHDRDRAAHRSLRTAVTDQNFYFVMADRFKNGDTANDDGGLPPGKGEGQSGFDPTGKGCYHGGDLKGLTNEARLHQGARHDRDLAHAELQEQGRPAGGQSAGYHGYWITDFTQIDPHLGHQRRPAHARQRRALARHQGLLRHHHQPHGGRHRVRRGRRGAAYISKDAVAVPHRAGHAVRRPRLRRRSPLPGAGPTGQPSCTRRRRSSFPYHPCVPAHRAQRQGPRLAQRRQPLPQPRRHDVRRRELPLRRLLRPRRPVHGAPARRRRDDRHLQGAGSATSASTASGWTR